MIGGRYLSRKKTDSQNISISPYLKDWVKRFIRSQSAKNPNDDRYKSVSAFYNYVMESVLKILESGKTLNDFDNYVDKEIEDFYDKMTFKAVIPFYEQSIKMNKYNYQDQEMLIPLVLKFRDFVLSEHDEYDDEILKNSWERFIKFILANNLTKVISLEISGDKYIVE